MVWGMTLPKGFGDYWPSGFFEYDRKERDTGWYDRLGDYFAQQNAAEQKRLCDYSGETGRANWAYRTYPVGKFTKEPGWNRAAGYPALGDVELHEVPQSFGCDKTYKSLASLIMLQDMLLAVDERLKAIIERLEPGVHEFFPFELMMPKGKRYPEQYYILRIRQYFDAFSREQTAEESFDESTSNPGLLFLNTSKRALNDLAVSRAVFEGAHLWRDRTFEEDLTCFSDQLIDEIKAADLRMPKHYKLKVV